MTLLGTYPNLYNNIPLFISMICHTVLPVHCSLMVTCWERTDVLALLCVIFSCVFVTSLCGVLGQVLHLIVFIPDLCLLPYFAPEDLLNFPDGTGESYLTYWRPVLPNFESNRRGGPQIYSFQFMMRDGCSFLTRDMKIVFLSTSIKLQAYSLLTDKWISFR